MNIKNYEGHYQVSNFGRIKSLIRPITWGPQKDVGFYKERILKIYLGNDGYYSIGLCKEGKVKRIKLHRLISEGFIPNPKNKPCINHKNRIKTDNTLENLEWCTYRENTTHYLKTEIISSKYIGVSWHKKRNKWVARIWHNRKMVYLGGYDTELEAHKAYTAYLLQIGDNETKLSEHQ